MVNVDAQAGAARYLAKTTNKAGMCLWEVQVNGYQAPASIGPHAGQYPIALAGWNYATQKHTDAYPPRGAAVYYGVSPTRTDALRAAGDVVISLGNGLVRCSDGAGGGTMATMTIAARAKQIARPYLGWTTDFLGHQLVNLGPAWGGSPGEGVVEAQYIKDQLGAAYIQALQTQLEITADGIVGPQTISTWLVRIGRPGDGVWQNDDNKAMQTFLGIAVDGFWGPAQTLAIKSAIDAKKFAKTVVVIPPASTYYRPVDAPAGSIFGVDVSRYQAGFDFLAYKIGAAEQFVILKRGGSNSGTYIDSQYEALLPAARSQGFKIGHYWFNGRSGVANPTESAYAFLRDLDIRPGEIVALDIENETATGLAHYTVSEALEWLHVVEEALGIKPFVYMSSSVARDPQWAPLIAEGYPLWVAMYTYLTSSPDAGKYKANDVDPLGLWGPGDAWQIHQYTSTVFGTMPGTTSKALDRNIAKPDTFTNTEWTFSAYPEPEPEPKPEPEPIPDYKEQLDRIEAGVNSLREHLGDKVLP